MVVWGKPTTTFFFFTVTKISFSEARFELQRDVFIMSTRNEKQIWPNAELN